LKEKLFIDGLESVMFVISKPDWKSSEGDPRFWNAKGVVQPFLLNNLYIPYSTQGLNVYLARRVEKEIHHPL
ncbi:hypothetical protein, partial [Klebsiella pneumoniae]|uniref:hypothetical protein n=1 Tax=Klebsiella pneumoniae TaxID=573 RepID=UPI003EDF2B41